MAKTQKYYVVWKGRKPGIYLSWDECKAQVDGFADAKYKAFESKQQANAAFKEAHTRHVAASVYKPGAVKAVRRPTGNYVHDSYCVDAACSGNPGDLEFRCQHTSTGEVIFKRGPYHDGTNNIGEFLAIVQALMWLKEQGSTASVYSDSKIAMGWVQVGQCRTKVDHTRDNAILFKMIDQAVKWLRDNKYENKLLKWETEEWGEIPADYGRK
jgi:ribonuclease HI